MYFSENDLKEAAGVAAMIGKSVDEVLRGWEEQAEFEANAEAAMRDMFPLDD